MDPFWFPSDCQSLMRLVCVGCQSFIMQPPLSVGFCSFFNRNMNVFFKIPRVLHLIATSPMYFNDKRVFSLQDCLVQIKIFSRQTSLCAHENYYINKKIKLYISFHFKSIHNSISPGDETAKTRAARSLTADVMEANFRCRYSWTRLMCYQN